MGNVYTKTAELSKKTLLHLFNITDVTADLLLLRGIDTPYKAYVFFNPELINCYSPFLFNTINEAIVLIKKCIQKKIKFGIFADSDIDGLTSLTIVSHLFDLLGADYCYRYPVGEELYGLTIPIIDEFRKRDVQCIITLDSGTRDVEEIAYAKSHGVDVIVCDHHEPSDELPDAVIINPKLHTCSYPFKELAGVGVAFKLCIALLSSYTRYYEQYVVILAVDSNAYHYKVMHRGCNKECGVVNDISDIQHIINKYTNTIILHYDVAAVNALQQVKLFNLKDYSGQLSNNKNLLKIEPEKIFPSALDFAVAVAQKMQFQQSKKMMKFIKDVVPLVTMGTIADMMPLVDENRTLVTAGISFFDKTYHTGINVIREHIAKPINADVIGWDISPLLNTPGRFGKTELAAKFFLMDKSSEVKGILDEIIQLNAERKNIIQTLVNKFSESYSTNANKKIIMIQSDEVPEGLTGIIANRIADQTMLPVIVIANKTDSTVVKGSGRVGNHLDFFSIVSQFKHIFEKLGGHEQAFGFSIHKKNIEVLEKLLHDYLQQYDTCNNYMQYDYELPIDYISFEFLDELKLFEPYGAGHKSFTFISRNCSIASYYIINSKHIKCIVDGTIKIEAMAWNGKDKYETILSQKKPVDIIYTVKTNEFNGLISPLLIIIDMHLSN